jgi:hypothetical protein
MGTGPGKRDEAKSKDLMALLRQRLQEILAPGLAEDARQHAEQVAQIAAVLYEAFEAVGLQCTLVGGSAIEVHAPGVYRSGDIDVVIDTVEGVRSNPRVHEVFSRLGFERKGRYWILEDLLVDTWSLLSEPDEVVRVGNSTFSVIKKEVLLRDRVVGFKWWDHSTSYGQQVVYMLAVFGDDLDMEWLRPELESEKALDAFMELEKLAGADEPITEETLERVQARLRGSRRE